MKDEITCTVGGREGGGANIEVQSWQWRKGGKEARRGEIKERW